MHSHYKTKLSESLNKEINQPKEQKYPVMTIKSPPDQTTGETIQASQNRREEEFNLADHLIPAYFTKEKAVEIFNRANIIIIKDKVTEKKICAKLAGEIQILDDDKEITRNIKNRFPNSSIKSPNFDMENNYPFLISENTENTSKISNSPSWSKNIKDNPTNNTLNSTNLPIKNKTGLLYEMFTSSIFDINWVISYIDKREETGIFDTLVNIMQAKHVDESIFYLPQLCTILVYKNNSESLEDYILDRCVNQMKFSLRIHWLIGSYLENAENEKIAKIYRGILQKLEETLVNGRRCTMSHYVKYNNQLMMESIEIFKQSIDKELRLKYFDVCDDFYKKLKEMCEKLKNFPREKEFKNNRNNILKDYIFMYNANLQNLRNEYKTNQGDSNVNNSMVRNFYKGVILPFDDCVSTMDEFNSLIVRIIPEYCFCFSTKARVPVKLCVECVKVYECEKWNELIVEESINEIKQEPKKPKENIVCSGPLKKESVIINELDSFLMLTPKYEKNISYSEKSFIKKSSVNYEEKVKNDNDNKFPIKNNLSSLPEKNLNQSMMDNIFFDKSLDKYMLEIQEIDQFDKKLNKTKIGRKNLDNQDKVNDLNQNIKDPITIKTDSPSDPLKFQNSTSIENLNDSKILEKIDNSFVIVDYNPQMLDVFGKKWSDIQREIKEKSPYRKFSTYTIKNFMAKADDDLRQELMTMQLIKKFAEIFQKAEINLKIRTYEILITSSTSGLIEFIPNTNSIDGIKKKIPQNWNLKTFYKNFFMDAFEEAQKNFAESLAAYSLICYYLQIKDRHNGNILIDMNGNIIHIDFGFILGISPGNLNFENAPFKMTEEYVEILDGLDSPIFQYYKSLMLRGMLECRKNVDVFVKIIEIMSKGAKMPCFEHVEVQVVIQKFRDRFFEKRSENDFKKFVDDLIYASYNNFWTGKYDSYQKLTNGILP